MNSANIPPDFPNPPNIGNELAKDRNRLAAERTLMAWIRTSLSMIGFGFGIDSVVSAILSFQEVAATVNPIRLSRILGLSFIALGIYALIAAIIDHSRELRHIRANTDYRYTPRRSLGIMVSIGLLAIGILAFISIALRAVILALS